MESQNKLGVRCAQIVLALAVALLFISLSLLAGYGWGLRDGFREGVQCVHKVYIKETE